VQSALNNAREREKQASKNTALRLKKGLRFAAAAKTSRFPNSLLFFVYRNFCAYF
jgi:hypothetical protein